MDSFRGTRVTANPWDCDVSPDGSRVYVVFAGTNDLYVCRILHDDYVESNTKPDCDWATILVLYA